MIESSFRFVGYRVSKIQLEIKDSLFESQGTKLKQSLKIEPNFINDDSNQDEISKNRNVEVILTISVKSQNNTISILTEIKGIFQADQEMSVDQFKRMAEVNAPAILYPYARAIITSCTAQANIPPLILPTINFSADHNKRKTTAKQKALKTETED